MGQRRDRQRSAFSVIKTLVWVVWNVNLQLSAEPLCSSRCEEMTSPLGTGETGTASSCFQRRCCPAGQLKGLGNIPPSWKLPRLSRQRSKLPFQSGDFSFISSTPSSHQLAFSQFLPGRLLSDLLLAVVVLLQRLLQFGGDLLEEVDLLAEVVLHLGAEVPYPSAVEMLDLCQRGAGNDVAAVVELALLLGTVLHLGQSTWSRGTRAESEGGARRH